MAGISPVEAYLLQISPSVAHLGSAYLEANSLPLIQPAGIHNGTNSAFWKILDDVPASVAQVLPLRRLPLLCDFISFLLVCIMLIRTFLYVVKRRSGAVGPSMAPILVRFWAVHGVVQFFSQVLYLYLIPFRGEATISFVRAPLLLLLCYGRRLPISFHVYQTNIAPFYEAKEPEIEERLQRARAMQSELDEVSRQLAVYLLQRMAVSGLSNLIPVPIFDAQQTIPEASISAPPGRRKEESVPLPQNTAVFPSSLNFFGGETDQRVRSVFAANRDNLGGVIQPARVSEMPKATYDNLRAFRRHLRDRLKKTARSIPKDAPR